MGREGKIKVHRAEGKRLVIRHRAKKRRENLNAVVEGRGAAEHRCDGREVAGAGPELTRENKTQAHQFSLRSLFS